MDGQSLPSGPAKKADEPPWKRLLTGDDARQVNELERKFVALRGAGKYAEARVLAQEILAIRTRIQGADHWQTADAQRVVQGLEQIATLPAGAQAELAEAIKLNGEIRALFQKGRYPEALPLLRRVLDVCRRHLGEDQLEVAAARSNLALGLDNAGRSGETEPLHRQALAIRRQVLGEEHPTTAIGYNNLALCLHAQGRYAEAEPLYHQALATRRRVLSDGHADTAQSYNNVAGNVHAQGRYAEAELLFQQALAIRLRVLGEGNRETAQSYNSLAYSLSEQGKHAAAEPLFRKALAIFRQVLGEENRDMAIGYSNLAYCLSGQGRHAEAEPLFDKALVISRRVLGEEHLDTANKYGLLAVSLYAQGKYVEAEPLYRKALATFRRVLGEEHPHTTEIYNWLAFNLHAQGKYGEAEALLTTAARSYEIARLRVSSTGLERAAFGASHSPLLSLAACLARSDKASEAWTRLEEGSARGLLDNWSARLAQPLDADEKKRQQELLGKLNHLDQQIVALLNAKERSETSGAREQALQEQRKAVGAELDQLGADLAARQVYDRKRIQAQLPADAALVAWVDIKGHPKAVDPNGERWACLLRRSGLPVWVRLPGSGPGGTWTNEDDHLGTQVRQALGKRPADAAEDWKGLVKKLADQRLAPLEKHLRGGTDTPAIRHLIVLPSNWMAGIPVEVLTDHYTISYASSGTMYARLQEKRQEVREQGKKPASPRLLALGDPVFQRPDPAGNPPPAFEPLLGTRREVNAIAPLFAGADRLLGSDASARRLEGLAAAGRLKEYHYLHLATHAVMDPDRHLMSALVLSQDKLPDALEQALAGKEPDDGRLTAKRILETWQLDAELVTLSACQTALGRFSGGEGYVGFSQALFLARARSLVLSLWKVDDRVTALLMIRFYENLLGARQGSKPMTKAEALKEAKRWLRNLTTGEFEKLMAALPALDRGTERDKPIGAPLTVRPLDHPYYWSAFILIGDPN